MILAAGLSPALQQIVVLDRLEPGEVNRAREVHWCSSGKVLNVGLALNCLAASPSLGTPASPPLSKGGAGGVASHQTPLDAPTKPDKEPAISLTLTLLGGSTGGAIRRELLAAALPVRIVDTHSPTRVCTTILDRDAGSTTELVQNAGPMTDGELSDFKEAYREAAREAEVVVLTGSFPAGVPATFYRELLEETRGRVVLDAQGEPLLAALERRPFLVKPNREELGRTLGRPLETDADLRAAMREICRCGAMWIVVSQGKERVWLASECETFSVTPPVVEVVNPIGSGDCLAAGIAWALARSDDVSQALAWGVAAAAENCRHLLPARLDPERVREMQARIRIERIGGP